MLPRLSHRCLVRFNSSSPSASLNKPAIQVREESGLPPRQDIGKFHGSYHWSYERLLSLALVPTIAAAAISPTPTVDAALALLLPLHCHLGLMCVVDDYLPKRNKPSAYRMASTAVAIGTLGSIYGLWQLNSYDVGVTETVKTLWRSLGAGQQQTKKEQDK